MKISAAIIFLLGALTAVPALANLKIVTTSTGFADLARQIGKDRVEVHSIMKGPENVHNVVAKPTEMVKLNAADIFVHSGLDAEPWRDNLLKGSRNPRVASGKPGNVDMSEGVSLKQIPDGRVDRSQGDMHAYGNPHYTLNPANARPMIVTLVRAMVALDPENADLYRENAKAVVADIDATMREVREQFEPWNGLKIATYHDGWAYLEDVLPIRIVGTIEPFPGVTPSASQVRDIVERLRNERVRVVVVETYSDRGLAKKVADDIGATLVVLPDHVNGLPEADTYQNMFRHIANTLIKAAKESGGQSQ